MNGGIRRISSATHEEQIADYQCQDFNEFQHFLAFSPARQPLYNVKTVQGIPAQAMPKEAESDLPVFELTFNIRCERLTRPSFGHRRQQAAGLRIDLALATHQFNDVLRAQSSEANDLTARRDGQHQRRKIMTHQEKMRALWRLFERLQKGRGSFVAKSIGVVEYGHFGAAVEGTQTEPLLQVADLLDLDELPVGRHHVQVGVAAAQAKTARGALAASRVRARAGRILAEEGLRKRQRRRILANAPRSHEEVGVGHLPRHERRVQQPLRMLMTNDAGSERHCSSLLNVRRLGCGWIGSRIPLQDAYFKV